MTSNTGLPAELLRKFEIFDWRNAMSILRSVHDDQLTDIVGALTGFELRWSQLAAKRGNRIWT